MASDVLLSSRATTLARRSLTIAAALACLTVGPAIPSRAAGTVPPSITNIQIGDCNGNLQTSQVVVTSTGTPIISFSVSDADSGLRISSSPIGSTGVNYPNTILSFQFDELPGSTVAVDSSTSHNNGQITGGAAACGASSTFDPCRIADASNPFPGITSNPSIIGYSALRWTGSGSTATVKVASPSNFTGLTQMTIEAWFQPADLSSRPIVVFSNGTPQYSVQLWISSGSSLGGSYSGDIYADFYDGSNHHAATTAPNLLTPLRDYFVTATYNGTYVDIYLNGSHSASAATSLGAGVLATSNSIYIGDYPTSATTGTAFLGYLGPVRILNTALSNAQALADYWSGTILISTSGPNNASAAAYVPIGAYADGTTSVVTYSSTFSLLQPGQLTPLGQGATTSLILDFGDKAGNSTGQSVTVTVMTQAPTTPAISSGTPQASNAASMLWSWAWNSGQPHQVCGYNNGFPIAAVHATLYSCSTGKPLGLPDSQIQAAFSSGNPYGSYLQAGLSTNTLYGLQVAATDYYGTSPLTPCTSAYTAAMTPGPFVSSNVYLSSMTVNWSPNGNPYWTRYEVGQWSSNFAQFISSPVVKSSLNSAATAYSLAGLSPDSTYYWKVWAVNGSSVDSLGSLYTSLISTAIPTLSTPPASILITPVNTNTVQFALSTGTTVTSYIVRSNTNIVLNPSTGPIFSISGLGVNASTSVQVAAVNASGAGPWGGFVTGYSAAAQPNGTYVTGVSSSSVSLSWNANGNPGGTIFQVQQALDSKFTTLVTTQNVIGSSATFTGLFSGTTYYYNVATLNGNGIPSPADVSTNTTTPGLSVISVAPSPATPYVPTFNSVGIWHFDEGSGTTSADATGGGNNALLTCATLGCVSTPTFVSANAYPGLSGLGSKVFFAGQINSLVSIPDISPLDYSTNSVSVEAWVYPTTSLQVSSAGIVAKGNGGSEAFALDVVKIQGAPRLRFLIGNGSSNPFTVVSSQTLQTGAWTHVAGVDINSGGQSTLSIYINGSLSQAFGPFTNAGGLSVDTQPVVIGNRQSGIVPYDLPFSGAIDEVHLLNRVLVSSEISSDYNAAVPSTFTANQNVSLLLPPNALAAPAAIYVSSDPLHDPIQVSPAIMAQGFSQTSWPTGTACLAGRSNASCTLIPSSVSEVVVTVNGAPYNLPLGSSATISIAYPDANNTGLVDGTSPPMPAAGLGMFTFNTSSLQWIALPSYLDSARKRIVAVTPHFSIFGLFGTSSVQPNLDHATAYPDPWEPGSGGKFDSANSGGATGIAFGNLPLTGGIRIFTLSGELVNELAINPSNAGTVIWNGMNKAGRRAASGVYFAYVQSGSKSAVLKFAIER